MVFFYRSNPSGKNRAEVISPLSFDRRGLKCTPHNMIAWIVFYYLIGAIPFGYLAGRIRGIDLRQQGSRNIGATNAWRVLGWKWGLSVFILDFLKGFIPVFGALNWLPFLTGMRAAGISMSW